ncbi:hypothetical protein MHI15_27935 [Paenibacillus sp. FSL H7-0918]|uniref:hypothetical protein n=1 Tax=Paenibacillus sp. FSL H7-0918 TaxID=2921442 RepID=UPI0030FA1699
MDAASASALAPAKADTALRPTPPAAKRGAWTAARSSAAARIAGVTLAVEKVVTALLSKGRRKGKPKAACSSASP